MELVLRDTNATFTVSDHIFKYHFNEALIHQVVVAYSSSGRQGTCSQKTRSEVAGSGKKPWRQKGTGRARAGSTGSPIWRSGGVTFAAKPQNYNQKINKKMYRGALRSILSELLRQKRLIVFEQFSIEIPKTKLLVQKLENLSFKNILIITNELNKNLLLAARNLYKVKIRTASNIDPVSLIFCDQVIITVSAINKVGENLYDL